MATSVLVVWAACCTVHGALILKVHLIYWSFRVLQEVRMLQKRLLNHIASRTLLFFMICVCECGLCAQVCNCLQWGWGTWFAEILQNPSGSLDRISLPAAADIVHVTALKEILSIQPSPAFFLLCIAWRSESLLSPFRFIKPTGFKCFSMFSFLYAFHTSL